MLSLLSCSESRPPKGFEAVVPQHWDTSRRGCPELSGSFDLLAATAQNALVSDWLGLQNSAMTSLVFEEWVGSNSVNYRVQRDKANFLAQAEQLRKANPADYYDWRKLTLEIEKNSPRIAKPEQIEAIQKIGPLLQLRAQMHGYGCSAGWMKVLEKEQAVESYEESYTRHWSLWVARDADGNLLLRTNVSRLKPGWTFWAAGGAGTRVIREYSNWHKVAKASQQPESQILREQDLPPVVPPKRSPDCKRDPDSLIEYNQELVQHLPEGVFLTKFLFIQSAPTDPCNHQVLQVGFAGGQHGTSEEVLRHIKEDKRVANLVLKETQVDANRQRYFLVEYTLILN
jgi:hypothetical protein